MPILPESNRTEEPVADWFHRNRAAISWGLFGLAVVFLVVAGYCGYRGFRLRPVPTEATDTPAIQTTGVGELDTTPFQIVSIASLLGALIVGVTAGYLIGVLPSQIDTERRKRDRAIILAAGGLLGIVTLLCGGLLFAIWFNKLGDWINGVAGAQKSAWMPVVAILVFVIGAGIAFVSAIPARGEERNNTLIRRLVYSSNLALSVLIGIVGLIVLNVIVSVKLPAKLDTTESGFYSLSDQTKSYLAGLKQDVKVYVLSEEIGGRSDRIQNDVKRLIDACVEINPQRFQVKTLSPVLDRNEIDTLTARYPDANLNALGVLVTTGDNFDRRGFIEFRKMVSMGQNGKMTFKGEAELIRELMFRTERESVVYFTQSSREPQIERANDPNAPVGRTALRLKDDLGRSQCVVKPLNISTIGGEPKVPDDADLVVVVDPLSPLPEATITAIQKYVTGGSTGKKKGRLLVFAGAKASADGKEILKTGLEPFLESQGILMLDRVIYSQPEGRQPVQGVIALPDQTQVRQRNPVTVLVNRGFRTVNARPVAPMPSQGGMTSARPLLHTQDGGICWLETKLFDPPSKAWTELIEAEKRSDSKYKAERMLTRDAILLAAFTTDKDGSPTVAAFGFSEGFDDEAPVGEDGRSGMSKVLTTAVDWLRERPPAPDIAPKSYGEYVPPRSVSTTHILWLPVISTLTGIVLLGLGVWVYRRK